MVSYYNSLTMFPAHHAASQPHSVAAASIAARHAASYFQGYHHPYGYPQHQFPPSATSPGNATVATSVATPTGHYPPNLSDLNSNVCPGSSGGTTISGPGFGPGLPSHHQHLDAGGGGFQPNPAITPPAWHTSQSAWHPGSPFWTGSCNVAGAGAPGQAMDGLLQQQNDLLSSAAAVSAGTRSPNTPPRGSSEGPALRGPSPGYPSGSHSSGSPNGTPTPVGNIYRSSIIIITCNNNNSNTNFVVLHMTTTMTTMMMTAVAMTPFLRRHSRPTRPRGRSRRGHPSNG